MAIFKFLKYCFRVDKLTYFFNGNVIDGYSNVLKGDKKRFKIAQLQMYSVIQALFFLQSYCMDFGMYVITNTCIV